MRATLCLAISVSFAVACGGKNSAGGGDSGPRPDACVGIECNIVDCAAMALPPTTISGKVFAPNGTLPLNGVSVYVPRDPLPAFVEGASCDRCATTLPGSPVVQTISDSAGNFRLDNVPAGAEVPLVITTGKWRREVTIASVTQCTDNAVAAAQTRLPKNQSEGNIPKIAITTGSADSMECLARKLGIDDSEITKNAGPGRIHLYAGNGVKDFKGGFAGGPGPLSGAIPFWDSLDTLKTYDIVILSCEGGQLPAHNNASAKSQTAIDAMKAYADFGGRVFASHWHNVWIAGEFQDGVGIPKPAVWDTIATWADSPDPPSPIFIDEVANPKGPLFADWMQDPVVMGTTTRDEVVMQPQVGGQSITTGRVTALTVDATRAERWVRTAANNPQMFQFTTPIEVASNERCGKVVFTDMHVTGTPDLSGNKKYPDHCIGGATNLTLTPQEKALAFMFFDIAGCVGGLF